MAKGKYQPETLEDVEAEDELFGEALNEDESHIEDVNVMARSDLSESSSSQSHIPLAEKRNSDHAGVDLEDFKRDSSKSPSSSGGIVGFLIVLAIMGGGLYLFTMGGDDAANDGATATNTDDGAATQQPVKKDLPPPESDEGKGDGTPTLNADTIIKGMVASGWRIGSKESDKMDEVVQTGMLATREGSGATVTIYESRTWDWADKLLAQTEPPVQAIRYGRTVVRVSDGPDDMSNGSIELGSDLREFKNQARDRAKAKAGGDDSAEEPSNDTTGAAEEAPAE